MGIEPQFAAAGLAGFVALAVSLFAAETWHRDALGDLLKAPICMANQSAADARVTPLGSYALPNVPGKRVTIVRVEYGPGGFTPPHRHSGSVTATITKGVIRSQLDGGPVQDFKPGETFFEPPGSIHRVSANASTTEPAELLAVFVADEGAPLTILLE